MFLSVVIPVYNSEKYLSDCIDSVMNQTFTDFEIILVNDGSSDGSEIICKNYSSKYDQVETYTIPNSGSAYARNFGLEKSKGKYISFIDSDDWIHPYMFEEMTTLLKEKDVDIISCDLLNMKADGKEIAEYSNCDGGYYNRERIKTEIFPFLINSKDLTQHKWPMRMVTKIYNKEFLLKREIRFANDLKAAQDFVFSVTCMYYATSFYYCKNKYYYYYRENFESRTHRHLHKAWENYLRMNNYLKELLVNSIEYDFTNQLELSKLHGVLSSISYVYRDGNQSSFIEKYRYTREFSRYYSLSKAFDLLDWKKMSIKKMLFSYLLKNKMYLLMSLLANAYYLIVERLYKKAVTGRGKL